MPEQQNIEYKSSWHDDYLNRVCGFANAQGGKIYIGKDDADQIQIRYQYSSSLYNNSFNFSASGSIFLYSGGSSDAVV